MGNSSRTKVTCNILQGILALGMGIAALVVGSMYKDQCPAEKFVDLFLVVFGAATLCMFVLNLTTVVCILCCANGSERSGGCACCGACGMCCVLVLDVLLSLFLFAWLIAGSVWVFSIKDKIQHDFPIVKSTYCDDVLYQFAFWFLIVNWILWVVAKLINCIFNCIYRKEDNNAV